MTAYTVQSDTFGLPPLDGPPPPPGESYTRGRFLAALRRDPPTSSTQNVHQQAQSFTNDVYIAVTAIMTAMSGATVCVMKRQGGVQKKSLTSGMTGQGESDWGPAESSHPLVRLFEYVNDNQTIGDYLAEKVLCRCLFGSSVEYVATGEKTGEPKELWNLRPNYLTHLPMSPQYPCGAWRYSVPGPFLWSYGAGTIVFDRRRTIWHKYPHPIFPWEGYSPLTAGAKYIDFLNSIIDSRQMAMDHGFTPDVIVKMFGAGQSEMTRFMADLTAKYSGSNRGQRVMGVDAEKIEIEPLNITPDKMAYQESHKQASQANQAIFGVNSMVTGQSEPGSYAAFYAALRAFRELKLNGEANSIGQHYTKHVCLPRYGPDYRVEVKLPPLMDPDLQQRQWATLTGATAAVTYTVNEIRASLDMEPMDGGDMTPAEFNQALQMKQQHAQQQMQMEAQQQMMAQQGQGLPGLDAGGESADPEQQGAQDAISGAVLESLGVRGGDGASQTVLKAWTQFSTKTGGVGARNETGRELYGEDAKAALAAQSGGGAGVGASENSSGNSPEKSENSSPPQKHRVTYTVGTKTYTADVPGATEEEAHQVVTALGGKVVATGGTPATASAQTPTNPSVEQADDEDSPYAKVMALGGGQSLKPTAPLHPRAVPIAQRAKQQIARAIPKLKPVAQSPAGQQALRDVAKWGRIAADKHADLIAATKNLDRAAARDLFLTILAHVVRVLPGVGGIASVATGAVRSHLNRQDSKQVQGAVKEHGKATKELEQARKRAMGLGVNPDQEPADTLPSSVNRNTGVTLPKNKAGAGSLPKRIGKGTVAAAVLYAKRLNKSLRQG